MRSLFELIGISIFLFTGSLFAQHNNWIDTSRHEGLFEIESDYPFQILVSNKEFMPSETTLNNLRNAKIYLDELFNQNLQFAVLFIENEKWMKHAYFPPPGMPQGWQGNIILGAGVSVMSTGLKNVISQLAENVQQPLKEVYGAELNFDLFYRESLGLHELGHLYQFKQAVQPQRKWLSELFATMCMYAFVDNECNSCYPYMNTLPEFSLQGGRENYEFKALKDFEEKYVQGMSPDNYGWYQMQLYSKAKSIIESVGDDVLVKLLSFLVETDQSKVGSLNDEELALQLKSMVGSEVSEVLTEWKYN